MLPPPVHVCPPPLPPLSSVMMWLLNFFFRPLYKQLPIGAKIDRGREKT